MPGVPLQALHENLAWYSEALTKSMRGMAFAVIGAIWAIFTAEGIKLGDHGFLGIDTDLLVRWAFVLSSGALIGDVLQYVAALGMTNIGIDRWDRRVGEGEDFVFYYDAENLGGLGMALYWASYTLFPLKLLLAIGGACCFFFLAFAITTL